MVEKKIVFHIDENKIRNKGMQEFPDEIDKNGVMEKSVVFFSMSTRWDDSYWFEEHEEIESKFDILDL